MSSRPPLEQMLSTLSNSIDWPPPSPHLAGRVLAGLDSESVASRAPRWPRLAAIAAAALVLTGVLTFSPTARQAMADLLNIAGVRIGPMLDEPVGGVGADLNLGAPVDIATIGQLIDLELRVPIGSELGPLDGAFLGDNDQFHLLWTGSSPVLLTQRRAYDLQDYAEKGIGARTTVQRLSVEGEPGLWIEGAPHSFVVLDADGVGVEESARLAANVLLWESNGVNHRLETSGDLQSALAIIETLERLP